MTVDFNLPHLGENINSADIIKVLVKEGDRVDVDQIIVEIETDKATVEVPSEVAGIVKKVHVKEGTKAAVGKPVITVEVAEEEKMENGKSKMENEKRKMENEKGEKIQQKVVEKKIESTGIYEFKIPVLGENIASAQVTKVLVKSGDKVEADQIVLEIETDKATVEVPTEVGGIVKEIKIKDGDKAAVGQTVIILETSSSAKVEKSIDEKPIVSEKKLEVESHLSTLDSQLSKQKQHTHMPQLVNLPKDIVKTVVPAAPSVRRFAREIGVDISQVRGSGQSGRISVEDVKTFAKSMNEQIQKGGNIGGGAIVGVAKETLPDFSKWGEVSIQPMSNVRRKTAEHLSFAWATVPHVTQFEKADITELEKIRKQFGKQVETAGGKLTVTGILLKVIASAMKVFPQFNSSVDMEKSEVIYKKYVNIGVAVDTEKGLLVPVIRDVDKKNITQISIDLAEVSKKARDKKLSIEDMQGGCFTISNLGGIGGTYFTPIVNTPEVAILGVSRSSFEPVYRNGEFQPRLMMPLSLSYDHRIIDGADAIRFLRWVVEALENPFLISLEG